MLSGLARPSIVRTRIRDGALTPATTHQNYLSRLELLLKTRAHPFFLYSYTSSYENKRIFSEGKIKPAGRRAALSFCLGAKFSSLYAEIRVLESKMRELTSRPTPIFPGGLA